MLSYELLYKEVNHLQSMTGKLPNRLYVYVQEQGYALQLIPVEDFTKYEFVGYTYAQSYFPVVKNINPKPCLTSTI